MTNMTITAKNHDTAKHPRAKHHQAFASDIDNSISLIHNMLRIALAESWCWRNSHVHTCSLIHSPLSSCHLIPPSKPFSNSVTRGISPLTQIVLPATVCPSACFSKTPPAISIDSKVGSGGRAQRTLSYVGPGAIPRANGRSGCTSTMQGLSVLERRPFRYERSPPVWSRCQ